MPFLLVGFGNFTFQLDFYKNSSYATPYNDSDYPLSVPLNEYVYLQYSVESSANLVVMAVNCKATRDGNFYSSSSYDIIKNGYVSFRSSNTQLYQYVFWGRGVVLIEPPLPSAYGWRSDRKISAMISIPAVLSLRLQCNTLLHFAGFLTIVC